MKRSLLIMASGAGPASDLGKLVTMACGEGWQVGVIATPSALSFLNETGLGEAASVRSDYGPEVPRARARTIADPDALIIAPATFNTINKIAAGIADNYALTSVAEMVGRGVPTVVVPFVNSALADRAPFRRAVAALRDEGLYVLLGSHDGWEPHEPGTGSARQSVFPWSAALEVADRLSRTKQ